MGYGVPVRDGVGAGADEKFFCRRRRRHCCSSGCGMDLPKVGVCAKSIGYGHFFKGVFSENTLYTFSRL